MDFLLNQIQHEKLGYDCENLFYVQGTYSP